MDTWAQPVLVPKATLWRLVQLLDEVRDAAALTQAMHCQAEDLAGELRSISETEIPNSHAL